MFTSGALPSASSRNDASDSELRFVLPGIAGDSYIATVIRCPLEVCDHAIHGVGIIYIVVFELGGLLLPVGEERQLDFT